jgi:adenylate cyclase class IV
MEAIVAEATNREIKCYCADFRPVRRVLRGLGARLAGRVVQTDTYFKLPSRPSPAIHWRLKIRKESGRRTLIAYSDSYEGGTRDVRYRIVEATLETGRLLETTLGVSAVVRKRRERWTKGSTLFNLDTIAGVGTVFEAEIVVAPGFDAVARREEYVALFGPHLGEPILGSNEDLAQVG